MTDLDHTTLDGVLPVVTGSPDWDDVLGRSRRFERRRKVITFAVAALVAVGLTASAFGLRALIVDKGFVGLPPDGATPSAPTTGKLVLRFVGRSTTDQRLTQVWVFADGRLIWAREGSVREGANGLTSGLLEQHLTPAGVEHLQAEVLSTGLFDRDRALSTTRFIWGVITARVEDKLVRVGWSSSDSDSNSPDDEDRTPATAEQYPALERLDALLANPGLRLPANEWNDKAIRAYVPSSFSVCYDGWPAEVSERQSDPSRILSLLPARAREILGGKETTRIERWRGWAGGPYYPSRSDCSSVTTDEARELVDVFDASALTPDGPAAGLAYTFDLPGPSREQGHIVLEPILPDGSWTSFRTG